MKYKVKPIKHEADYLETLKVIEELIEKDPKEGSELFYILDSLITLTEAYESKHYKIPKADAISIIKAVMEAKGLKQKDLEPYLGPKSRVSEILNRKRKLSTEQIYNLHKALNIPLEDLVNEKNIELEII
jgi:HTH-type transcriptional regulator / antitoxin HigA